MLSLEDFTYELPASSIAHTPAEPRDSSRLLVLERESQNISHHHFRDLAEILPANVVLVRNVTKVMPARLYGRKDTGGAIELLLVKKISEGVDSSRWECLTSPSIKPNQEVHFEHSPLVATCVEGEPADRTRILEFNQGGSQLLNSLHEIGLTPLPPYIHTPLAEDSVRAKYQTVYAQRLGSVAAPTAGLHFTPELLVRLQAKGIQIVDVTLHVSMGTFMRVSQSDITQHDMHSEWYELSHEAAEIINAAKADGKKVIAVGTTSCRVLETCGKSGQVVAGTGETKLYVFPPYHFQVVDGLITNFHESKSTLLMLVSAFVSQPNTAHTFSTFADSSIGRAYATAITENYRFLSFGDGMLIF